MNTTNQNITPVNDISEQVAHFLNNYESLGLIKFNQPVVEIANDLTKHLFDYSLIQLDSNDGELNRSTQNKVEKKNEIDIVVIDDGSKDELFFKTIGLSSEEISQEAMLRFKQHPNIAEKSKYIKCFKKGAEFVIAKLNNMGAPSQAASVKSTEAHAIAK